MRVTALLVVLGSAIWSAQSPYLTPDQLLSGHAQEREKPASR